MFEITYNQLKDCYEHWMEKVLVEDETLIVKKSDSEVIVVQKYVSERDNK